MRTHTSPPRRAAGDPRPAPDRDQANSIAISDLAEIQTRNLELADRLAKIEKIAADFEGAYHQARSELGDIHQSRMWKLWMGYFTVRRALTWPIRALRAHFVRLSAPSASVELPTRGFSVRYSTN